VEHQVRVEQLLASAGVETLRMLNGEIGTYNDHHYHASSTIPEGQVRLFFAVRGQTQDVKGTPIPFREDARILDRQGRLAKLSFMPI
jgi:3-mercaptopyruvate sulfurtransferase SseA